MSNSINPVDQGMHGKIGDKIGETATTRKLDVATPAAHEGKQAQKASGDTVQLTSSAKLLERLEKTLAETPAVDSARIDAVRADIENGDYVINADKIADALLRTDLELGE
jgi:negative regulator of flagellin synthesis FlgM